MFLDAIGARFDPQGIPAAMLDLLPCDDRAVWTSADIEAVHDHISRNQIAQRSCTIGVRADTISFTRIAQRRIVHAFPN